MRRQAGSNDGGLPNVGSRIEAQKEMTPCFVMGLVLLLGRYFHLPHKFWEIQSDIGESGLGLCLRKQAAQKADGPNQTILINISLSFSNANPAW